MVWVGLDVKMKYMEREEAISGRADVPTAPSEKSFVRLFFLDTM